ncbi:MAG TPA: rhodanese-like domain-containing protein [Kouleothrix sp.]|uniref:rhodanese-like domain-containing protein n=1 Tax=Kouleothrix sp. TaxID=2779161 RepID=UPI002B64B666|nr:rhodanese-like domain-containing protein [Kouleothrix sp.]HRC74446.1 rhodanese-like domain-containing protein [Kouleothrix sp.]
MAQYANLTVEQVHEKLQRGDDFRLIDVREPHEHAVARIEGAELLPLSRANEWVGTLPADQEIVFFCHHGGRSAQVAAFLAGQRGFGRVANMLGGINEWSIRVDPAIARY